MSRGLSSGGNLSDSKIFRDNICVEYILEINEYQFESLFKDSRTKAVAARTNCRVELTPRVLNKRINLYRWAKFAIVKVIGPDEASLAQCLRLLERQFPIFMHRKEYSRRANVTMFSEDGILPENTVGSNRSVRSASALLSYQASTMKGPLAIEDVRPVDTTISKFAKSHVDNSNSTALILRKQARPPIPRDVSKYSILNKGSDKLSRNEMFGLLGLLSNKIQNVGYPLVSPFDNVTVRVSFDYLDNEAKSSQTSFNNVQSITLPGLGGKMSYTDESKGLKVTLNYANDPLLTPLPVIYQTTDIIDAKSIQMPLDKVECPSESLSSAVMAIEPTNEALLTSKLPNYEKHVGKYQPPYRPITDRKRLPPRHSRTYHDLDGKHGCGADAELQQLSRGNDLVSVPTVSVSVIVHSKSRCSDEEVRSIASKYSNENVVRGKEFCDVDYSMESMPDSSQVIVSMSSIDEGDDGDQKYSVQLSYVSESEHTDTSTSISMVISTVKSERVASKLVESRSISKASVNQAPVSNVARKVTTKQPSRTTVSEGLSSRNIEPISHGEVTSNLSFALQKDGGMISAVVEIHRSTQSSEGIAYMSDQQRKEMEFKTVGNNPDYSRTDKIPSNELSRSVSVNTTKSGHKGGYGRAVSGIKVGIVHSRSSLDDPQGVYVKGMNENVRSSKAITPGVSAQLESNSIAQSIAYKLKHPVDGTLVLMFDGRDIYSTGTKSVAIRPTNGDFENSKYDFKTSNYRILAKGRELKNVGNI